MTLPPPSSGARPDRPHHDLDALEFGEVRELLMERLMTPVGRTAVEALAPFGDPDSARAALQVCAEVAARMGDGDRPPLQGAVEVRSWLGGFFAGEHVIDARDLADLKRLLRSARQCAAWSNRDPRFPALVRASTSFPPLGDLISELEMMVDDRGEILDSASVRLQEIRREIDAAEMGVNGAVQQFLASGDWRRVLQSTEPSWRNGRPVFQVRAEQRGSVSGVLHDRSQSGATLFIEPDVVVDAANRLADARAAEHREIQVVLAHAARGLKGLQQDVETTVSAVADFDLAVAKARLIAEDDYRALPITDDGPLQLFGARHPILLRQHAASEIVPLNLTLGDPHHLLVVTGPNTGGKTVALKSVGLLALMTLSGVPVPAEEGSSVPWLDAVKADIGDEQEISQSLSTFSSHVQRIVGCLEHAGPRTLLLLDELGAGTDPEEGGVLGYSVLESLLAQKAFAVVTTHLGRLKDFAYRHEGAQNGSMAFDGKTQAPLYRLDVGIPGASHALDIAARVGMPKAVVDRARELIGDRDASLDQMISDVQQARMQAEKERRRTSDLNRKAKAADAELKEKLLEAERKRAWLEEEADYVVEENARKLRGELEEPLKALANAAGESGRSGRDLLERLARIVSESTLHRRRMRFVGTLRRDATVFLPRWHRRGVVKKIDKVRQLITVEYGKMRVEVPFEDVSWLVPLDGDT